MNIEAYIASGILELYLLGELSEAEAREVEAMAIRYPAVEQELARIQETMEAMARQSAVQPRPALKDKILNSIPTSADTPVSGSPAASLVISRDKERKVSFLQYGIAASIVVAVISIIAALYFRSQWKETEQRLSSLQAQNQQIAQQYETASQELEQVSEELAIVGNRNYQAVAMTGLDPAPNSLAYVYWNQDSDQVYLKVDVLPPNTADKQYQLWAIVDGQPVSAGVFDVTDAERQKLLRMESIENASAFAVTLEPKGGSESPTLEAMYVQGPVENT